MNHNVITYQKCPVCSSSKIKHFFSVKDFTVSQKEYEIWQCADCTVRFTQHVPTAENIGQFYRSEQYVSHTNTSKGIINKIYHLVKQKTLRQKVAIISQESSLQKGHLLDVGAGTGAFANAAKKAGWNVLGLEPDAGARRLAHQNWGIGLQPSEVLYDLQPAHFDAITLWHVLEHVHDLHGYVRHFYRILKPSGILIIAVPNYTSFDAAFYKEMWAAYDVPRHLYHFSPKSMKKLLSLYDFEVKKTLPMKFDSYYVSMLSEKNKNGFNNFLAAFATGLKSNIAAGDDAEKYSSVIYVVKKKI